MLWSLVLIPVLSGAALFAAGPRARPWVGAWACLTLAATFILAVLATGGGWTGALRWSGQLTLLAALPPVAAATAIVVPAVALPVLLYASAHEKADGLARLVALLLVFVGGMELLVIAADLLTLLVGWEIVGACSWALIGHHWRQADNPRGGLYAFVATRLGDLGLFAAAMAAFAGAGSFAYEDLAGLPSPYLEIMAFGVLVSAAAKSGQVPFSPWLFRAMAGPTSVSALLHAATMVAAGAYILVRLHPALAQAAGFGAAAIAVGLTTALAGGVVALLQAHAKKLLAASTSAQFGLMFVAAGAGYPGVALLHLIAHATFKAPLFLAAGIAGERAETYRLDRMGFGRALPLVATLSGGAALSLAAVPPLGGGWTKEMVVAGAEHESLWVAAGVVLAGALSAAYATRLQLLAYGPGQDQPAGAGRPAGELAGLALAVGLTLVLSVLWLPAAHADLAALLGVELPKSTAAGFAASLVALGLGLAAGLYLVRRHRALGTQGAAAATAEWLGLPNAIRRLLVDPFARVAIAAARFDDAVLDAAPRGVARSGSAAAGVFARGDGRVVDRGVEWTAAVTAWLAGVGGRVGEFITDGIPEGTARLVAMGGSDARRLQTGLSHHYYALLGGGVALSILLLIVVS